MNSIPAEIWATLIGLFGALTGYAFREYLDRIGPFFEIISVESVGTRNDAEELNRSVAERLRGSFYVREVYIDPNITGPKLPITLGEIYDRWDRADNLQRFWRDIKSCTQELLRSNTDEEYLVKLSELLKYKWFDPFFINAIEEGRIHISTLSDEQEEIVNTIFDLEKNNGSFWINFPHGTTTWFGRDLNSVNRKAKCEPFIRLVRLARRNQLNEIFKEFLAAFDREYEIATSVINDLKSLYDKHSRWACKMYFANLSTKPLMIKNRLTLEVGDTRNRKLIFREPCKLVTVQEKEFFPTNEPIVVPAQSASVFGLITAKIQGEMQLGVSLQDAYQTGEGRCRVLVKIRKTGLMPNQYVKSGFEIFSRNEDA